MAFILFVSYREMLQKTATCTHYFQFFRGSTREKCGFGYQSSCRLAHLYRLLGRLSQGPLSSTIKDDFFHKNKLACKLGDTSWSLTDQCIITIFRLSVLHLPQCFMVCSHYTRTRTMWVMRTIIMGFIVICFTL